MYEPLLPKGTNFSIMSGPVVDSGYCWYRVELATGLLDGGITHGWVAQGSRTGLPWIKNVPIDQRLEPIGEPSEPSLERVAT